MSSLTPADPAVGSISPFHRFTDKIKDRIRKYRLEDTYRSVTWAYACINAISEALSSLPLGFYYDAPTPSGRRPISKDHDLWKLFNPPKQWEIPSCSELVKRIFINLGNVGEAFLIIERVGGVPKNISLVGSNRVMPKYAADGVTLLGWTLLTPTGQPTPNLLKRGDIIPLTYYNPYDPYRGLSPLAAGRLSIEQEVNMSIWNAGFFLGGVRNPLVIMIKRMFASSKQRMSYLKDLREMYSGFASGQGPMLVEGGSDVRPLFQSLKDLDFIQGKKISREEICGLFGVPPAQVGIFEYANYANSREQRKLFWDNTVTPKAIYLRDMLQTCLLDIDYPGIVVDWDWRHIERKNEDPLSVATAHNYIAMAVTSYLAQGFTLKQISVILNRPELDPENNPAEDVGIVDVSGAVSEGARFHLINPPQIRQIEGGKVIDISEKFVEQYGENFSQRLLPGMATHWNHFVTMFSREVYEAQHKKTLFDASHWSRVWERSARSVVKQILDMGVARAFDEIENPEATLSSFESIKRVNSFDRLTEENPEEAIEWFCRETASKGRQIFESFSSLLSSPDLPGVARMAPETLVMMQISVSEGMWIASRIYHHARFMAHCARGVAKHRWVYNPKCEVKHHASLAGKTVNMWQPFAEGGYIYPHSHDKTAGSASCYCTTYPVEMT